MGCFSGGDAGRHISSEVIDPLSNKHGSGFVEMEVVL